MSDVFLNDSVDELRFVLDGLQLVGCFLTDADGHGHVAVCCRTATAFTIAAPVLVITHACDLLSSSAFIKSINRAVFIIP